MDFPSWKPEMISDYPAGLKEALGVNEIVAVYKNRDLLVELNKEEDVAEAKPDFTALKKMGEKIIITAPGKKLILCPDFLHRLRVSMKTRLQVRPIPNLFLSGVKNWERRL